MLDDLTDKWRNGEKLEWVSARFRDDQLTDAFLGVKGTTPPHPTAQAAHTSPHADTQQPPPPPLLRDSGRLAARSPPGADARDVPSPLGSRSARDTTPHRHPTAHSLLPRY